MSIGSKRDRLPPIAGGADDDAQAAEDVQVAELVKVIQAGGNGEAFSELYRTYFDRVYGYMRLILRDEHEAEDAAQQVFINVLKGIDSYEPLKPFRAWLF